MLSWIKVSDWFREQSSDITTREIKCKPQQTKGGEQQRKGEVEDLLFSLDGIRRCHVIAGNVSALSCRQRASQPPVALPERAENTRLIHLQVDSHSTYLVTCTRCFSYPPKLYTLTLHLCYYSCFIIHEMSHENADKALLKTLTTWAAKLCINETCI